MGSTAADLSRTLLVALVVAVCTAVSAGVAVAEEAATARDEPEASAGRLDGDSRVDTAATIAERTFSPREETTTATVARADDFPDALAAAAFAGAHDGPVLLTWPDELPERTRQALDALEVDRVVVLGGAQAIDERVAARLAEGREVERLAGADRWRTAGAIARAGAEEAGVGDVDGRATALIASGETFADALSAGPLAVGGAHPLLLAGADHLPEATERALDDLAIEHVVVVGGTAAVGDGVVETIEARGTTVERIAGGDRTATAAAVADALIGRFGFAPGEVALARGDDFADALAAGPRAGARGAPLLLAVAPDRLGGPTADWLAERCPDVERVEALGGTSAVNAGTLRTAVAAAEACGPERTITYETGTRGEVHADPEAFRGRVADALSDDRGWALDGDLAFTEVADGGDLRIWLAAPSAVDDAHEVCSPHWSCRVGDDVYLNDHRWRESTDTYRDAGRSLVDYRRYVVNHETGHWLGQPDLASDCDDPTDPAPVMSQQSIALRGCATNVWPLPWERDDVRARWLE